ncbi:MAG: hypothetical protein ACI4A3_07425 [Lachnospiraceae bacterium]
MKKILGVSILSIMLFAMTGCMRGYEILTVNPDGSITQTEKTCISKEYMDSNGEQPDKNATLETLEDGKQYYTTSESKTTTQNALQEDMEGLVLTKDIFYYPLGESDQGSNASEIQQAISQGIYLKMTVNLGDSIVDTNANVSAETSGKTASFDTTGNASAWYAFTAEGKRQFDNDTTAPVINGIKNNTYYMAIPKITYSDNIAVEKVMLNGVSATPVMTKDSVTVNKNTKITIYYDWFGTINGVTKSLKKEGKNVFTVYDIKGNSTSVTFYLDTKAPIIKGIKNNQSYRNQAVLYIKDKQQLSKVTVNKKKQALSQKNLVKKGTYKGYYKITVSKKGTNTITAYDKAGNKKTLKIKIIK